MVTKSTIFVVSVVSDNSAMFAVINDDTVLQLESTDANDSRFVMWFKLY